MIKRSLPLVAMLAVAAIQMTLVATDDLSRWRGGGFGMYSEPHPDHRALWLVRPLRPRTELKREIRPSDACRTLAETCVRWPSERCLSELADTCLDKGRDRRPWKLEVVELALEPGTMRLGHRQLSAWSW